MATATADDPIRAEVERVLHSMVDASLLVPRAAWSAATVVPRCLVGRACRLRRQLAEPMRVARSFVDLAGGASTRGVVTPDDAPAADEVLDVAAGDGDGDAPPTLAVVPDPAPSDDAGDDLPIEEYESLAASQVVARLATLRPDELVVVRDFETAHRGRRTILGKIDQLLA